MKIRITAAELPIAPNGYTVITAKADDEFELDAISAQSIIDAGHAVDAASPATPATPEGPKVKTPEQMTKAELAAYAADTDGITLDATKTKADMLAEYDAALAAKGK